MRELDRRAVSRAWGVLAAAQQSSMRGGACALACGLLLAASIGNASGMDVDGDGIVGPSDFFALLRPCMGAEVTTRPECAEADLDGDGVVGASDFFTFRPALGSSVPVDEEPDDEPDDLPVGGPADFNGYRGPDRNGVTRADVGLADDWSKLPGGEPKLLWQTGDLGVIGIDHTNGQVSVWEGKAFAVTYFGGKRTVFAFDEAGREMWRQPLRKDYGGTHSANPSAWVEDGRVYIHDDEFDYCFDALTGAELWKTARAGDHKSSPIVIDGVYVMDGNSGFVGKDSQTGGTAWRIPSCPGEISNAVGSVMVWRTPGKSYALLQFDENNCLMLVDPLTGGQVWTLDPPGGGGDGAPNTSPLIHQDRLVLTSRDLGSAQHQVIYEVFPDDPERAPEIIWSGGEEIVKGSPVIHQGHAFWGYTSRHSTYAQSMDVRAGLPRYFTRDPAGIRSCVKGYNDLLVADGKLYGTGCLQSTLARPSIDGLDLVDVFDNDANHQTTPTVVGGRMYVYSYDGYRQGGERKARVKVFDVAAPAGAAPTITQRGLPNGAVGKWYEQRLWVSSGNGLRTWSLVGGSLPEGLTLDGDAHMLVGRPESAGSFSVTFEVRDADGDTDRKTFGLTVQP